MTKSIDVLGVGAAYFDLNFIDFPFGELGLLPETEIVGDLYGEAPGGSALTSALICAQMGFRTAFVGKIGLDRMGSNITSLLEESKIRSELIVDPAAKTNISVNFVNSVGQTIMAVGGNAKQRLTGEEVEAKISPLLPETKYLMLGSLFKLKKLLPVLGSIVAAAKDSDTKIVVDHGRIVEGVTQEEVGLVKEIVVEADYYFPSTGELTLWSVSSIEEGLGELASKTNAQVIVKDGRYGAHTIIDGKIITIPAYQVHAINTIAAGDSYNAGYVLAHDEGMSIEDSMRFAGATSALKISRSELPTRKAVEGFIKAARQYSVDKDRIHTDIR